MTTSLQQQTGGRAAEKDWRAGVDQQRDVNQQGCAENSKHHAEACKEHHHVWDVWRKPSALFAAGKGFTGELFLVLASVCQKKLD